MPSLKLLNRKRGIYPLPHYSISAANILLYDVTLTYDVWPWTFAAYRLWRNETLYQIWTHSSNLRPSIAISVFDLMTLNIVLRVALSSEIIFTKFDFRQLIRAWIIAFFDADTLCHALTLTFDPLTLKVRGTSASRDQTLYEIRVKSSNPPAELLIILQILYTLCHAVTLTFDLLTLNFHNIRGSCI